MAITPLPTPPSRADSVNFAQRGDAFMSALPSFATEANALAADVSTKQGTASAAAITATEQADIATTKAGESGASAAASLASKNAAGTSEANALTYKNAAGVSAGNAATSETAAATSAASVDAQGFATDYAGATEPSIKWAYMTWADTGNMLLKRRNAADSAWIVEGPLLSHGSPSLTFKAAPSVAADDVVVQSQVFGIGQSLSNDTGSKVVGVTYTNSTGKPKTVYILATASDANGYVTLDLIGNILHAIAGPISLSGGVGSASFVIPPGYTYRLITTRCVITIWLEYR